MSACSSFNEKLLARHILCFMLFTGFMTTFLLRVNINLAIVAMVAPPTPTQAINNTQDYDYEMNITANATDEIQAFDPEMELAGFTWSEVEQSVILSSFFWGYLLFQAPGGRVAEIWGTKKVFGASILINGLLSMLIPGAATLHWSLLLCVRALQGLAQGVVFPCLNAAVARWVPPAERASFISFAMQGASLGTVVALPLCGAIISQWGWPAVFYVSGLIALVWFCAWTVLIYDSPHDHPRITEREKRYLEQTLKCVEVETRPVPWRSVLTSLQFWVGVSANVGNDWGFHMFCNFGPKYIKSALAFDLEQSSWLSSLPFLSQYVFATVYAGLCDFLLRRQVPTITVRKMSVSISHLLPAVGMVALAVFTSPSQATQAIVVLTISVSAIGALSCGFFQNPLDIAPNFAGSLTGVTNAIGALTAVVSTPLTGAILQSSGPQSGWQIVFCIAAVVYLLTSLPYLLLATARLQPWNDHNPSGKTYPLAPVTDDFFDGKLSKEEFRTVNSPISPECTPLNSPNHITSF